MRYGGVASALRTQRDVPLWTTLRNKEHGCDGRVLGPEICSDDERGY